MVDSSLNKIKPEDTTVIKQIVTVPKNIEKLPNFKEQEKVLQEGYIKDKVTHKKNGANQKNDN